MKAFIATFLLSVLLGWLLPFWGVALIAFLAFVILGNNNLWRDFGWAFLAGMLAWGGPASYFYIFSQGKLPERISKLFSLPSPIFTLIITFLIGGILASFAGASGSALRSILRRNSPQ